MNEIILYFIGILFIFVAGFVCGWKVLAYLEDNREKIAEHLADRIKEMENSFICSEVERRKKKNK